jgi:hypothetical protein
MAIEAMTRPWSQCGCMIRSVPSTICAGLSGMVRVVGAGSGRWIVLNCHWGSQSEYLCMSLWSSESSRTPGLVEDCAGLDVYGVQEMEYFGGRRD